MNPGCYAMDTLRRDGCYRRKVRIFHDDPRTYTIRWFIVPDCTPPFPGYHIFGSGVWSDYRPLPSPNPGELLESPMIWDRGLPPAKPKPFRGKLEWYEKGVPISALGP